MLWDTQNVQEKAFGLVAVSQKNKYVQRGVLLILKNAYISNNVPEVKVSMLKYFSFG